MTNAPYERKPNSGFFGQNKTKKGPNSPDYTGSVLVGEDTLAALIAAKSSGKPLTMFLSGWKKVPKGGGDQFISLMVNAGEWDGKSKPAAPTRKDEEPF